MFHVPPWNVEPGTWNFRCGVRPMDEIDDYQAHVQRRRDLVFLALLFALLAAVGFSVVRSVRSPFRDRRTAAGEIRAIDPALLRSLIRSGHLSTREAVQYRRPGGEGAP
jgi:hypothetical protein